MNTIKTLLLLLLSVTCLRAQEPLKFTSAELAGKVYNVAGSHAMKFSPATVTRQSAQRDVASKTFAWKLVQGVLVLTSDNPADTITFTLLERQGGNLRTRFTLSRPGADDISHIEYWQLASASGRGTLKPGARGLN